MGNESQCGTNKSREPRSGSRAICLFCTAIHFPWTEKKRSQFTRFVCSALRFISHEPRKKDTHSLYLQCLQQRPLLKFSEQSKEFKFPAEIGHLTLFQDKTILAYSFRQNSAGSCRRFCRLICSILMELSAMYWCDFEQYLICTQCTGNALMSLQFFVGSALMWLWAIFVRLFRWLNSIWAV